MLRTRIDVEWGSHLIIHAMPFLPPSLLQGDIRDPLKRDVLKPMYERRLMGNLTPPGELGKHTLDTKMWSELLITSTPYGHCVDKSGNYVVMPMSDRWGEVTAY